MLHDDKVLFRIILGLALAVLAAVILIVIVWVKLSGDEHTACIIQSHGLPASHELSLVMHESYRLFTAPLSHAQKLHQIPPSHTQSVILGQLKHDLSVLSTEEAKQPFKRIC